MANAGTVWDESRRSLGDRWGGPPTLIEPVVGEVTLRGLMGARKMTVQPLDAAGLPLGEAVPAVPDEGAWHVGLGASPATVWYLVAVERG